MSENQNSKQSPKWSNNTKLVVALTFVASIFLGLFGGSTKYITIIVFTCLFAVFFVYCRLLIVLPASAIGDKISFKEALRLTKDYKFLSIYMVVILPMLFGILFNLLGFLWIDPLAGAVVALFILKTGVEIIRDSTDELMKTSPESSVYREIEINVAKVNGVNGIEDVYVQYFGIYMMINITIFVNGEISVREGDLVADKVEEILYKNIEYVKKVNVHFHPKN